MSDVLKLDPNDPGNSATVLAGLSGGKITAVSGKTIHVLNKKGTVLATLSAESNASSSLLGRELKGHAVNEDGVTVQLVPVPGAVAEPKSGSATKKKAGCSVIPSSPMMEK